jgi:hypothetical protein
MKKPRPYTPTTVYSRRCALIRERYLLALARKAARTPFARVQMTLNLPISLEEAS